MRFSAVTAFAFGGLLTTSAASPVVQTRQESTAISYVAELLPTIKTYTGAISQSSAVIVFSSADIVEQMQLWRHYPHPLPPMIKPQQSQRLEPNLRA